MTIQEKRAKIKEYCGDRACIDCKLANVTDGKGCFLLVDHATVERNYEILFGDDEPAPEQHFITVEPADTENDTDTTVRVRSSRKIDRILICFKEEN